MLKRALVGFDAQQIQLVTRKMRDHYGKMAYFLAALKAIPESKRLGLQLVLDGQEVESEGFACIVGNAANMGMRGLSLSRDVSVSDGLLDLFAMRGFDLKSLVSAVASIANRPLDADSFRHWQARETTITTDPTRAVIGDGDSWGETPTSTRILPGTVQAIASPEVQS